jgi:hypothetical protein
MSDGATADQASGWLALATGVVAIATIVALVLFFALAGGPFGIINDFGNALVGTLSAVLAFRLSAARGVGIIPVALAFSGAVITIIGSWLVVTETTGFFLAGLVSSVGFALIGGWLLALSLSAPVAWMPSGLNALGRVAAAAMLVGLVALPGIPLGIDDMDAVPPWLWAFSIGWLGTYVLYPVWSLWLARHILASR